MVVPNTIEIPGAGSDIYAATRVVSLIPGEGTDLTIAAALAALPAEGGLIFIKQGTYAIAASLVIPDKPVAIRGAGDGTIIDIGANAITAFTTAFDRDLSFESFRVTGDGSAGQVFFSYTGIGARVSQLTVRSVLVGNYDGASDSIEIMFLSTLVAMSRVRISDSFFVTTLAAASRFISLPAASDDWRVERSIVTRSGGISGSPELFAESCDLSMGVNGITVTAGSVLLNCRITGDSLVTMTSRCRVSGCLFDLDAHLLFTGSPNLVANSVFRSVIATHIEATGSKLVVDGCSFANFGSEAILLTTATECVITGNENCEVTEAGGGVDSNRFDNNTGFAASTIIGPNSVVNGARRKDSTDSTTDAFVVVFTHTNFKGLLGIGTVKNTDAVDTMDVRETVTDAFGVTSAFITSISPGNDYMLDPQTYINLARPPYTSYAVAVRSTVGGAPATYELHHVSQGDM